MLAELRLFGAICEKEIVKSFRIKKDRRGLPALDATKGAWIGLQMMESFFMTPPYQARGAADKLRLDMRTDKCPCFCCLTVYPFAHCTIFP